MHHAQRPTTNHQPPSMHAQVESEVFPAFGSGPKGMAASFNVPYLGKVPLDPNLLRACEEGVAVGEKAPGSPAVAALDRIVTGTCGCCGKGGGVCGGW